MDKKQDDIIMEEKPPVFKSWAGVYRLLVFFLILQILIYYYLTVHYSISG